MSDYDVILRYKKLKTVTRICKENGIDMSNLMYGRTSEEKIKKLANIIRKELGKITYDVFIESEVKTDVE